MLWGPTVLGKNKYNFLEPPNNKEGPIGPPSQYIKIKLPISAIGTLHCRQ